LEFITNGVNFEFGSPSPRDNQIPPAILQSSAITPLQNPAIQMGDLGL
jgi:hypothetical protein